MRRSTARVVRAVIRREYLQRVRSKWFVISTLGAPLVLAILVFAPIILSGEQSGPDRRDLVLVDRSGLLANPVRQRLQAAGWSVRIAPEPDDEGTVTNLLQAATDGDIRGFLVTDSATLQTGLVRYTSNERPSALRSSTLRQVVVQAVLEIRLAEAGVDVSGLIGGGDLEVDVLATEEVGGLAESEFVAVYGGAFLLYFTVLLYAVAVMRSVLEEKTSRVVEVVLSSMRPFELMMGKIVGVGAVGLTQIAVWVGAGALFSNVAAPALRSARPELAALGGLANVLPGPGFAALFLLFFLSGYFIYAAMYAAVGAMTSSDQEAQQAQAPMVLLMIIPVMILPAVIADPDSLLSVVTSLVPFFAPVLMFARAAAGAAPVWQVALSVALMAVTLIAVAWLAGRIYRVGILMTGKRPTLRELWRWVRRS